MKGINKVILLGHLGKDPELKNISGYDICNFTLATDESYVNKNKEKVSKVSWHNIIAWGPLAIHCANYLEKGSLVYVEGQLEYSSSETDGVKKYYTKIKADVCRFLSFKSDENKAPAAQQEPSSDDMPF